MQFFESKYFTFFGKNTAILLLALLTAQCKKSEAAKNSEPATQAAMLVNADRKIDFNRDVRPILSDRCFGCHGPDGNKGREAGLRLDTVEGATAELKSGNRAIIPGNIEESEMVTRIHSHDPEEIMPSPKLNRPLNDQERAILTAWIKQGAEYQPHWAFVTPKKYPVPSVIDGAWCKDDIDRFTLAKMEEQKIKPNALADRATLLRRVSFTLTGLPPSPEQVEAFVNDPAPNAYEKVVDALLASPHYGERLAQDWLDVSRFADTYGYQSDKNCFVYPWRDWVIKSFNENLSFDKFATWQVAGDLLPNATQDQKLATAFNRLHRQTEEGGSIEAEFRQEYVSDRVHTFGTAFLGLTMECCKCHDHKYDPISQKDYYSMASMFGQIDECGLYPYSLSTTAPAPSMHLMEPHHPAEVAKRAAALESAEKNYQTVRGSRDAAFDAWLAATATIAMSPAAGQYPFDSAEGNKLANLAPNGAPASIGGGQLTPVPGVVGNAMTFDGDTLVKLDGISGITRNDALSISLRILSPDVKPRAVILHSGPGMYSQSADASGFELLLENGKLRWSCIHLWPGCAASIETKAPFPIGKFVQVTVTYDGSSSAAGLKMYFDGKPATTVVVRDRLDKSIVADVIKVGARPRDDRGFAQGQIDDLSVFRHVLTPMEVAELAGVAMDPIFQLAKTGNAEAKSQVKEYYLAHVDADVTAAWQAALAASRLLHEDYLDHIPLMMCMEETPYKKQFHVLTRGDYASPDLTKPVEPTPPAAVMAFAADAPRNRLGLAQWMIDPKNPLVSRVAVNRFWMMCFGNGLVATQENFGLQGDAPTHQELLDTLSNDFITSGWDMKKLLKRIVMSSTFQQSSTNTKEKLERDPKNQLLSRGPNYRLSGEAIRDQALVAAGLLVEKIGGPSVKPWQPPGLWSEAGASGGEYKPDSGEGLYRRSLYTYRKRTAPPPSMVTLDAGSREICQPRRLTTNTPLQPLIFLNDLSFFECARKIAKRVMTEKPGTSEEQVQRAFQILTNRPPRDAELKALAELFASQKATYEKDPVAAKAVSGDGNPTFAALTIVCSTLLTSDAVLTVR